MGKYAVEYALSKPMGGVRLTGGALMRAFEYNIDFLKGFDPDRMLYWYRVHKGKPAPGAPYAGFDGHFENNLKGQTAGEFLMGAGTSLLWREDVALRATAKQLLFEMEDCRDSDGFVMPITREEFHTKEYPNYTRAWITFGLLDAGYAGEEKGFALARDMSDFFNHSDVLPYVKDMNLGFQGILANTRMYDAPNGVWEDVRVAIDHYQETWWLEQVIAGDHKAIYDHPGNHPHSTLLTTLEGYLDLYRATGEKIYIDAVKAALPMYEDKWQHVGGGINMCEFDHYYPGCNWLSPRHHYNELCSTNFWVLLNQRMRLLFPEDAHFADEMENSIYNVLLGAQVGGKGYHYLNYLEGAKDYRYLDRGTCCASLGTRLAGLLPQFIYTYTDSDVYVDLFAQSGADLPNGVSIKTETDMPENGRVKITIERAEHPFTLHVRIPRWAVKDGKSYYEAHPDAKAGDVFEYDFPFSLKLTKYSGGDEIPHRERWAVEYGPLLYAAIGAPSPFAVKFDPARAEDWFTPDGGKLILKGDRSHEYRAYKDILDEPFCVYPIVERP